jgi:hypothetical protein
MGEPRNVWTKKERYAPFNDLGLMSYDAWDAKEWRSALTPFSATMRYEGYGRGRSAIIFNWIDTETGLRYPMFVSDMDELLQAAVFVPASTCVRGAWEISKRGANYGIRLLKW